MPAVCPPKEWPAATTRLRSMRPVSPGTAASTVSSAERGDVDRITAAARTALGTSAFTNAYESGALLTAEEAMRRACKALAPSGRARG